jgi:hypothetical protein
MLLMGILFSTSVLANDGGAAYLEVLGVDPSGIKPEKMSFQEPYMTIYGK